MSSTSNGAVHSSSPSSRSARLRAQGNVLYKQVKEGGYCFAIKRGKLARALHLYQKAVDTSSMEEEVASAHKNMAMVHWLFCQVELDQQLVQLRDGGDGELRAKNFSACKSSLLDAVKSLSKAREHGMKGKPQAWLDQLEMVMKSIVEWASKQTSVSHSPLLLYVAQAYEDTCLPMEVKLLAHKMYADALFKEALCKRLPDQSLDYRSCHSLLHDCCVSLRKGAACSIGVERVKGSLCCELQELQDSVDVHLAICEAMQAIALGDQCMLQALLDEEEMQMEKVKDALDCYRQASLATRELDMETEAMAVSRIGRVYSNVFKMHEQAHKYHFQSVRLALTVMSPSIARTEWYQESLEKVKAHQEKVAAEEKEKHEKERKPALQRLKGKLEALNREANKGAEALLKYIYQEHPHPDLNKNVVPLFGSKEKVKASLKKAILHYHPDTNMQHGEDWKILCEEICKHLNAKYAVFK